MAGELATWIVEFQEQGAHEMTGTIAKVIDAAQARR